MKLQWHIGIDCRSLLRTFYDKPQDSQTKYLVAKGIR